MSQIMDENVRVDLTAFPIRKMSRWHDAALWFCVTLGLILVLCPFFVVYCMEDARPLPIVHVLWQSIVISLGVFPIVGAPLGVHWCFRRAERVTLEEAGIGFVDMFGRRHHLPWAQVTGVRYNVFFDALLLKNGNQRVFVQNCFVEPDLVMKYILKKIPDSARRSSVAEFLYRAFSHGTIEALGPWLHRFLCHIAYVRWGGVTRVPKF